MNAHFYKYMILAAVFSAAGIPCKVSAQEDALLSLSTTPSNIAEGHKEEARALGVLAYEWGYPLIRMERTIRKYTDISRDMTDASFRAPVNRIGWSRRLPTYKDTDMPTANNDTYYMSSVLTLEAPFKVKVPDTGGRYYVINIFDMYHNIVAYIGKRTTGTKAGTFWIVPPEWKGNLPADTYVFRPKTNKVWLFGRIQVNETDDVGEIHRLQNMFSVEPVVPVSDKLPEWVEYKGRLAFFHNLAQAMKYNSYSREEEALIAQFRKIGLEPGKFSEEKLTPSQIEGLTEALKTAPKAVISNAASATVIRNGWQYADGMGEFGYNYGLRALVSGPYLGGQGSVEAMYPIRYVDDEGKILNGQKKYNVHFSSIPDVKAFWSLTVYDAKTKLLVKNPINRYKISSTTPGIKYNKDGSLDICLNNNDPGSEKNWLPLPEGEFYLLLRLYQPSEEVLNGTYELPSVKEIK